MPERKIDPKFNIHASYRTVNILNPYRYSGGGGGGSYLVDSYPTTGVGWFPFRIKSDFDKCLRLRRSSDNAETDLLTDLDPTIYISLNSSVSAGGTLGNWIGANTAYVVRAYDMTGNGYDYIQNSSSLQPYFVINGNITTNTDTGKPALYSVYGEARNLTSIINPFPSTGDITFTKFSIEKMDQLYTNSSGMHSIQPAVYSNDRRLFYIANDNSSSNSARYAGGNAVYPSSVGTGSFQNTVIKLPNTIPDYYENGVKISHSSASASQNLNIQSDSAFTLFGGENGAYKTSAGVSGSNGYSGGVIWYFEDMSANRTEIENFIQP